MAKKRDPYATLGVGRDADAAEIGRAFKRRAKDTHPDKGGSAEAFAAVKGAHLVLSDPSRRAYFDRTGEIDEPGPDNAEAAAMGIIAQTFDGALFHDRDPLKENLIPLVRRTIEKRIEEEAAKVAKLRRAIPRAEKIAKRIIGPSEDNRIARMLNSRAIQLRALISKAEQHIAWARRAVEILDDYAFDYEMAPFAGAFTVQTWGA